MFRDHKNLTELRHQMESPQTNARPKALLVSVRTPKVTESEALESMIELERLVTTLGYEVTKKWGQAPLSTLGWTLSVFD